MNPREFNSIMHFFNERWAAEALGMKVNPSKGPDLIDDDKIVEVKFKVVYPNRYMHISWRVLEYQMDYERDKGRRAYWALGTYLMAKPVAEIKTRDIRKIESLVLERRLTVVPWDWLKQFQPYHQTGNTKKSKWDNTIRFPKGRLLPSTTKTYQVQGGEVNISEGVDPTEFITLN